jgi:hypothetical protein
MATEQAGPSNFAVTALATCYALSAPGANVDIFTAVNVSTRCVALRITLALATTSIVDLQVTDGSTAYSLAINDGNAITADLLKTYEMPARCYKSQPYTEGTTAKLSYSLRVRTNGIIKICFVDEIGGVL